MTPTRSVSPVAVGGTLKFPNGGQTGFPGAPGTIWFPLANAWACAASLATSRAAPIATATGAVGCRNPCTCPASAFALNGERDRCKNCECSETPTELCTERWRCLPLPFPCPFAGEAEYWED